MPAIRVTPLIYGCLFQMSSWIWSACMSGQIGATFRMQDVKQQLGSAQWLANQIMPLGTLLTFLELI